VQVRVGSAGEHGSSAAERLEGRIELGAPEQEIVDREARLARQHLEPEHIDAVIGEVLCDRCEASCAVAQTQADEPRAPVRGDARQ
jgi:hypothetical protein